MAVLRTTLVFGQGETLKLSWGA